MNRATRISTLLHEQLNPSFLEIIDDSHKHITHLEGGKGESHYRIHIQFNPAHCLSRLESHRLILDILDPEFQSGLHSISIKIISK